jgi:hypothetical protein
MQTPEEMMTEVRALFPKDDVSFLYSYYGNNKGAQWSCNISGPSGSVWQPDMKDRQELKPVVAACVDEAKKRNPREKLTKEIETLKAKLAELEAQ